MPLIAFLASICDEFTFFMARALAHTVKNQDTEREKKELRRKVQCADFGHAKGGADACSRRVMQMPGT